MAIQPQLSTSATVFPAPAPTQPLAKVTKRRRCSPEVVHLLEMLAPTPEESMVPPPPPPHSQVSPPRTTIRTGQTRDFYEDRAAEPSATPVGGGCSRHLPPPHQHPHLCIVLDNLDETMRLPFYRELEPLAGRQLGTFEWVAFEEVLCRWSAAINEVVNKQQQRPSNPTSHWARRQRRRGSRPGARPPSPNGAATSPPTAPSPEPGRTDGQGGGDAVGNRSYRTPGIARRANEA